MWSKAVAARKTLITIESCKWKKDALKAVFDSSGAKSFAGVLNEKHMMIVVSADLSLEEKSGWLNPPTGKNTAQMDWFREKCKFAVEQASSSSGSVLSFLFDGRSREAHRVSQPQ